MRIALCQLDPIVGDFDFNLSITIDNYRRAVSEGVDLVVFPELIVTGYPPQDLLLERPFVDRNLATARAIVKEIGKVPAIFGFVDRRDSRLYNTAGVAAEGQFVAKYDKLLLPTYDVFDEDRYFESGKECAPVVITLGDRDVKVGLEICEDLWDQDYDLKVSREMADQEAEFIVNISASPYSEGKGQERTRLVSSKASDTEIPFLYCNMVGSQDELVFDGHSLAYDGKGRLVAEGKQFEEDMLIVNLDGYPGTVSAPRRRPREEEIFNGLVLGVRDYFRKTGHYKSVIGLSGGIDSALTTCIAVEALGNDKVTCVSMPSRFSSKTGIEDSAELAENLGVRLLTLQIDSLMEQYEHVLKKEFQGLERDTTEENIQARIRGNILMALSNKVGSLVLSTGNKTELALGYCTLYGDMSGGLAVISDLSKSDVYALSRWYNGHKGKDVVPARTIEKPPSAELTENQVDPFDYEVVSPLVDEIVEHHRSKSELVEMGYDGELVDRITHLLHRAEFKRRQAAPGLRVTSKAFGMGRRMPVVNHFEEE